MTDFKLGPLQTEWLKQLREYPERQMTNLLGKGTIENYRACCLGELHVCAFRMGINPNNPFKSGAILDEDHDGVLARSHEKYGLYDDDGEAIDGGKIDDPNGNGMEYRTLAGLNDGGVTWPQIADIIEADPSRFFFKSV